MSYLEERKVWSMPQRKQDRAMGAITNTSSTTGNTIPVDVRITMYAFIDDTVSSSYLHGPKLPYRLSDSMKIAQTDWWRGAVVEIGCIDPKLDQRIETD